MATDSPRLSLSDLFDVFLVKPHGDGRIECQFAGRLLIHDDHLSVLADYFGHLSFPEGPMTTRTRSALAALRRSPYFAIVSLGGDSAGPNACPR